MFLTVDDEHKYVVDMHSIKDFLKRAQDLARTHSRD